MAINKTDQTMDRRLVSKLNEIDREVKALKRVQLLGGDNLVIGTSNISESSITLSSFQEVIIAITVSPSTPRRVLTNLLVSVFVDNDWDANYLLPVGVSLRQGTAAFPNNFPEATMRDLTIYQDMITSDDNRATHYLHITNVASATHTFYIKAMFLYPKVSLA